MSTWFETRDQVLCFEWWMLCSHKIQRLVSVAVIPVPLRPKLVHQRATADSLKADVGVMDTEQSRYRTLRKGSFQYRNPG